MPVELQGTVEQQANNMCLARSTQHREVESYQLVRGKKKDSVDSLSFKFGYALYLRN